MRSLGRIVTHVSSLWPWYIGIVICSMLTTATGLVSPFVLSHLTDYVVSGIQAGGVAMGPVIGFAVLLLAFDLANTVIANIGGYFGDTMGMRLRASLSSRYFEKLLSLPQRYFDDELTGTIIGRLSRSINEITQFLKSFANNFFTMLLTVAAVLVITARYSLLISALLVLSFPLYTYLTTLTSKRWQRFEQAKNHHVDLANGRFAETIGQIRVVKSFVQERRELVNFDRHYDTTVRLTGPQSRWWHGMDSLRRGMLNVIFFGIHLVIFVGTARGQYSIGTMVLLVQLVNMASQPATMMSYLVDSSQRAIAGSRDYFQVMATPAEQQLPDSIDPPELLEHIPGNPAVDFDHLGFGYEADNPVLADVSFQVNEGERVALVSESGGGKTTLISLLMGLYQPSAGTITLGGYNASDLSLDQLRAQVGVVFQEPVLFSGTIRENITYANPHVSDDEIRQAAQRANAEAFIASLPHGYDTVVGERGLKLSGGQKQRIAIARAMIKDAPILVLDEATSALDTKAERAVQRGLDQLMEGRTSIIIAHRLSTIASVDRIVTLRDGQIDEIGTPAELATTDGIYAQLLALQASGRKRDRRKMRAYDIER